MIPGVRRYPVFGLLMQPLERPLAVIEFASLHCRPCWTFGGMSLQILAAPGPFSGLNSLGMVAELSSIKAARRSISRIGAEARHGFGRVKRPL